MQRLTLRVVPGVLGFLVCATTVAAQTPITQCGSSWAGDVVLIGDLDCSGDQNPAVTLQDDAKLDLAGFTLTGGHSTGVSCLRDCTIVGGGGTITGAELDGVAAPYADLAVSDILISGNGGSGIAAWPKGDVVTTNVTLNGNGWGVDGGSGIEARVVAATGCTADGNRRSGFFGEKDVTVSGSTATGNRRGVYGHRRITLIDSTVTNNTHGVYAYKRLQIDGSTVTGNPGGGAWSDRRIEISNSTFADNDTHPDCTVPPPLSSWPCIDIVSIREPRISTVACETSARVKDGYAGTWGICAND